MLVVLLCRECFVAAHSSGWLATQLLHTQSQLLTFARVERLDKYTLFLTHCNRTLCHYNPSTTTSTTNTDINQQVEDIIDSGHTLARLSKVLKGAGADTVKVVALLDKKGRRRVEFFPDYVGWEVSG